MKRGIMSRLNTGLIAVAMVLTQVLMPVQSAFATGNGNNNGGGGNSGGNGGNENCPAGTIQLAKFNLVGNSYVKESGNFVTVTGNDTGGSFTVTGGHSVSDIVIKGSNDAATVEKDPSVTEGTFSNSVLPLNNGNQRPAISNIKFCERPAVVKPATGVKPMINDMCGTQNDTYTITATTGVDYQVGGVTKVANTYSTGGALSVTVTAVAQSGYALMGDTSFVLTFTNTTCETPKTPVTPNVTVIDLCEIKDDSVTAVAVTGVSYSSVTKNGLTYTVTASPSSSQFVLAAGNGFSLSMNGTATFSATLTDDDCVVEPTVIPLPMGIADVCGRANDTVPMPEEGDNYSVLEDTGWDQDGDDAVKTVRTITYIADEGYVFENGEGWMLSRDKTEATYTFTDFGTKCASVKICPAGELPLIRSTDKDANGWTLKGSAEYIEMDGGIKLKVPGAWVSSHISRDMVGPLADIGSNVTFEADPSQYVGIHIKTDDGRFLTFEYGPGYDNRWWSTSSFDVASDQGYATMDTLENIVAANPDVKTSKVYVLYTHPQASSSVIKSVTVGCTKYVFSKAGGEGGVTTPVTPIVPTVPTIPNTPATTVGGQVNVLPEELPLTGQNGSILFTWIALLAAILTYGSVYYLQPKKRLEQ